MVHQKAKDWVREMQASPLPPQGLAKTALRQETGRPKIVPMRQETQRPKIVPMRHEMERPSKRYSLRGLPQIQEQDLQRLEETPMKLEKWQWREWLRGLLCELRFRVCRRAAL